MIIVYQFFFATLFGSKILLIAAYLFERSVLIIIDFLFATKKVSTNVFQKSGLNQKVLSSAVDIKG